MITSRIATFSTEPAARADADDRRHVVLAEQLVDVDRHRGLAHPGALHRDPVAPPGAGEAEHAAHLGVAASRRRGTSPRSTGRAWGRRAAGRRARSRRARRRCGCSRGLASPFRELSPPRPRGQRARPGGGAARRRGLARGALGRPGDAGARGRRHPDPARRRPDPVARAGRRVVRRPPRAARRARRAYLVRAARRPRRRAGGPGRLGRPARGAAAARRRRHEWRRPLRGAARLPRHRDGRVALRDPALPALRRPPRVAAGRRRAGVRRLRQGAVPAHGPGGDHGDHARRAGRPTPRSCCSAVSRRGPRAGTRPSRASSSPARPSRTPSAARCWRRSASGSARSPTSATSPGRSRPP